MGKNKKGKNKADNQGFIYSTDSSFQFDHSNQDEEGLQPSEQLLYVSLDKKQRGGKQVTLIENFIGSDSEMKDLAKLLKSKCGVGGGAKDGEIFIQGDHRNKVVDLLEKEGYRVKRKGG